MSVKPRSSITLVRVLEALDFRPSLLLPPTITSHALQIIQAFYT